MTQTMSAQDKPASDVASRPLRILFFTPRQCWPADTGAKLRDYHLARELAKHANVTYLGFRDELAPADMTAVEDVFDRVELVPRSGSYSPLTLARGLVGGVPANVMIYSAPEMRGALERLLREQTFDLVHIAGVHLAPYLPIIAAAPGRPAVWFDWHNIESELMQRYGAGAPNVLVRAYARRTASLLRRLEIELLASGHGIGVPSARERDDLIAHARRASSVHVIENGVDCAGLALGAPIAKPSARTSIVFVGSMDYHANADGVVWFANDIWPALASRWPELTFRIVGRRPGRQVSALATRPGIEVTGAVDDVRPYYAEALAAVVPLRVGGGTRLKILEAMAAGIPVISTRLGAEGLELAAGKDLLLAETAAEFARAIEELMASDAAWFALSDAARNSVAEKYDWPAIGEALFQKQRALVAGNP